MQDYSMLDSLQQAVIQNGEKKRPNKYKEYLFDQLSLFFREDYVVNGITISQPTIGDILQIGEMSFYGSLRPFIYNSTSIRLMLWNAGIDWCTVSDIEVFSILVRFLNKDDKVLKLIFNDVDMTDFRLYKYKDMDEQNEKMFLYSERQDIKLLEDDYMEIAEYIREMFDIHPKIEKAKGKATKKSMIDEDKINLLHNKNYEKAASTLLPLISGCLNHPGFKYRLQELKEVGIYQFMDSVKRLQIYESSRALLNGRYSGFCDLSKMDEKLFSFLR